VHSLIHNNNNQSLTLGLSVITLRQEALHGEKYETPSAPQTGSNMVEEQLQSALHEASSTSSKSWIEL